MRRAVAARPMATVHVTSPGDRAAAAIVAVADGASMVLDPSLLPENAKDLPLDDPLNDYVEAHVHGGLVIGRDVEALVIDPTDL